MKAKRQSQEHEQFARQLHPFRRPLVLLARRLVNHHWDAEDALQAALTRAWRCYVDAAPIENFRAWMARFVILEACNVNRRRALHRDRETPLNAEPYGIDAGISLEQELTYGLSEHDPKRILECVDRHLADALLQLSEGERTALLLRAILGLKCREIAEVCDTPHGTVLARLYRAREKLRVALVEYAFPTRKRSSKSDSCLMSDSSSEPGREMP